MFLGVEITWGHIIMAAAALVVYDFLWSFIAPDPTSTWWFARLQFFLKGAIYAGIMVLFIVLGYLPFGIALLLVLATVVMLCMFVLWQQMRKKRSTVTQTVVQPQPAPVVNPAPVVQTTVSTQPADANA